MRFAPLDAFALTERRTAADDARNCKDLSHVHCPKAENIVLVQDKLNTHVPASL